MSPRRSSSALVAPAAKAVRLPAAKRRLVNLAPPAPLVLVPEEPSKKKPRRPLDAYYTPPPATAALLREFPEIRGKVLFDPSSGDGRMSSQILAAGRFERAILNDIATGGQDATRPELWEETEADWAVSNIPFCHSATIPWRAIERGMPAALLMRVTFLEPTDDRMWLVRHPPTAQLVLWRISFDGSGETDSTTCSWFIWGPVTPRIRVVRAEDIGQLELFS